MFFMAFYTHCSILESVSTIYNNILKCCRALITKVLLRISIDQTVLSSVTKFIAEHDRVPHVLRNDVVEGRGGMRCDAMIKEGYVISFP